MVLHPMDSTWTEENFVAPLVCRRAQQLALSAHLFDLQEITSDNAVVQFSM